MKKIQFAHFCGFHILTIAFLLWGNTACLAQCITVIHTSDTHSCIEPVSPNFPDSAQAGKGGFIRRTTLVEQLRKDDPELLLLDCGDFSQGSVYYNLFHGKVEIELMNLMKYDACAIGNHEFDFGLDNLASLMKAAKFPFVCCNYDFTGTPCEGLTTPYIVLQRHGLRIGIFGVSPKPEGLITASNYQPMKYTTAAQAAQPIIDRLRGKEKCDIVICLSHLGWGDEPGMDADFVAHTTGIDLLLGGHTHTYATHPLVLKDKIGHEVTVSHMGKNARFVGSIALEVK